MMTDLPENPPSNPDAPAELAERPWIHLQTTHDVEAWIGNYDWDLRRHATQTGAVTAGICFRLEQGGEIIMHTTPEGEVLLDVGPEAEWVSPLIAAATGVAPPSGERWTLPSEVLTQLIFGLSSLIAASRPVVNLNVRKKQRITW